MKGIFTTKPISSYNDLPEMRYHFPKTYLNQVERIVGDWIIYYEPRRSSAEPSSRGGRRGYFATARVVRVEPDTRESGLYYASAYSFTCAMTGLKLINGGGPARNRSGPHSPGGRRASRPRFHTQRACSLPYLSLVVRSRRHFHCGRLQDHHGGKIDSRSTEASDSSGRQDQSSG